MPPCRRDDLQRLPDMAVRHHAAQVARPDVGGEDLDAGMAVLHGIGELAEMRQRHLAHQRQVEAVVAVAGVLPLRLRLLDRLLDGALVHALHEVDQGRGAAVQGGRLTCDGGSVSTSGRPGARTGIRQWMCGSMPPGMTRRSWADTVRAASGSEPAPPTSDDASVLHADIGGLGSRRQHAGAAGDGEVEHQVTPASTGRRGEARRLAVGEAAQDLVRLEIAYDEDKPAGPVGDRASAPASAADRACAARRGSPPARRDGRRIRPVP